MQVGEVFTGMPVVEKGGTLVYAVRSVDREKETAEIGVRFGISRVVDVRVLEPVDPEAMIAIDTKAVHQ